jgi:hypothetical protein
MATIDELLNDSNEATTCTVNPDTREIIIPEKYKFLGVFSDEKVTRIPFTCPKVVGNNVDLTEYKLYINYQNANGGYDAYPIDDVTVSGDNIIFSWLLSRYVTLSSGVVKYNLCAKKLNGDTISNEWNTTIANGTVINGLEATQEIIEEYPDTIEMILSKAHTHENKSVLDKFDEVNGKPTYDGKTLGSGGGASTSEDVSYTNTQSPSVANVKEALDVLIPKSHSHTNKDILDKLSISNDKLQYNGSDVGLKGDKGDTGATGLKGEKGDPGVSGTDGITPHIGTNGNWYLGTTDTGKPSKGEQGPGAEVFYIDLAGSYPKYTCPVAMDDIKAAYEAGKVLKCRCRVGYCTATLPLVALLPSGVWWWVFSTGGALSMLEQKPTLFTVAITEDGILAEKTEVVNQDNNLKFPNPNALTIKIGSTTVTYDGSSVQTVEIADGTGVSY